MKIQRIFSKSLENLLVVGIIVVIIVVIVHIIVDIYHGVNGNHGKGHVAHAGKRASIFDRITSPGTSSFRVQK